MILPEMATDVWIPRGTPDRFRALLPSGIDLHELPRLEAAPARLGPGQFVVAGFSRRDLPELLQRIDDVHVVQAMSAGIEDLIGHLPDGAVLCDGAGVHDASVGDWVLMVMLAMYRRLPFFVLNQEHARWSHTEVSTMSDLEEARVLIVGYGSIGRAVEARLNPFGVAIQRVGRRAQPGVRTVDALPELLPEADVVVILLPLTEETHRFVDAQFLSRMKPGALLVNAARGKIVDTQALVDALREKRIRVALDVTDPEPLPDDHPLWKMDGVLITPHIGGAVARLYERGWRLVADQLRRYLNGQPLRNVVSEGY